MRIFTKGVSYLGHVTGQTGIRPDEKRIRVVKDYPKPRTTRERKEFLGLAVYCRSFIPNISNIAMPLTGMLK